MQLWKLRSPIVCCLKSTEVRKLAVISLRLKTLRTHGWADVQVSKLKNQELQSQG